MPKYIYTAMNVSGQKISGTYEADSILSVTQMIQSQNYYLLTIHVEKEAKKREITIGGKINSRDIGIFCNQFSTIVRAGVPITQALDVISAQSANKRLKKILEEVSVDIKEGKSITEAFEEHRKYLPELFINIIEAGELSGNMEDALSRVGQSFMADYRTSQKVKSVLIYPEILSVAAIGIVTFLVTFIVPTFTSLYAKSGTVLPLPTRILLSLSSFLTHNFILVISILAFIIIGIRAILSTPDGRLKFDKMKMMMPIIGKPITQIMTSRFTRSMSMLTTAGVHIIKSVQISAQTVSNAYVKSKIDVVIEDMQKGRGFSGPLEETGLFPPMMIQMAKLGEESGALDDLMKKSAAFYEEESDMAISKLTALIEPVIILIMGGLVLFIILSLLLPMFGMYSMVG